MTRPRTPWGDLAETIKTELWLDGRMPRSADRKPWSLARELSIAKHLLRAGWTEDDLIQACRHVRDLRPDWRGESLSLRVFYAQRRENGALTWCATPLLEQAVGLARKRERPAPNGLQPFTIRMGR